MCAFVALGTQHEMRMRRIVICGMPGSTISFRIILWTTQFAKESYWTYMCVVAFSTNFVWKVSHYKKNWARYDQKCTRVGVWSVRYFSPIFMRLVFSRQVFEKYSYINFHENPSSGSRVHANGQTDRQTDMTKVIVAFGNFGNAPKKRNHCLRFLLCG